MAESIKGLKRTDYCGKFDISNVGQTITVFGYSVSETLATLFLLI